MLATPMDVHAMFPVRKSCRQKQKFRDAVQSYSEAQGYSVHIEKGSLGTRNIIIGDPENAKYLITAHYDTCARMLIPNFITPCNFFMFLGYQLLLTIVIILLGLLTGLAAAVPFSLVYAMFTDSLAGAVVFGASVIPELSYLGIWFILAMMLLGPANKNNSNDNTSGVITLLEIMRSMPENQRHKVCFVLFDLEEAGLIGSASYRKKHKKATDSQIVLNLDCVGDGDHIMLFPTKKLKQNENMRCLMYKCCGYFGKKSVELHEKGFSVYPSDQANFPYGVGICALHKGKSGLYLGRIHTNKDTILDETNVNILRAGLISMISCDAV